MNDIHDHVRLAAVAAGCKAAEMRRRKRAGQNFGECDFAMKNTPYSVLSATQHNHCGDHCYNLKNPCDTINQTNVRRVEMIRNT